MGSLEGKTALVTGATAGIGFYTAVGLAERGARVFVTARDESRGREAILEIRRLAGHDAADLLIADASLIHANVALANEISKRLPKLDILVKHAGGVFPDRRETVEGVEATLGLNFIGPFALTTHLLPLLTRSDSARIVNVVSSAFAMWKRDPFDDLEARQHYVGIESHARAKLLNLLFTLALARRLDDTGAVANAVNPGMAWTPGVAALTPAAVPHWRFVWLVVRWVQRRASAEAAARAPLFIASSPDAGLLSARYFDGMKEKRLPRRLSDASVQDRAWSLGESLVSRTTRATRIETIGGMHGER